MSRVLTEPVEDRLLDTSLPEVSRHGSRLAMISRVTDRLVQTLNFDEALHNLIEGTCELLRVERASIMMFDPGNETLSIRVAKGVEPEVVETTRVRTGDGIAGRVAASGEPLIMWDVRHLQQRNREQQPDRGQRRIKSYKGNSALCVPLKIHGKVQGVMNFTHKRGGVPFDQSDLEFAMLIANQAAIVIYSSLLHEEFIEKMAIESELRVARSIQQKFLPREPPAFPGFRFAARCVMSSQVGGDYCGFVPLDEDRLAIAVGDVEGHGVPSALLMANAQACLSTALKRHDPIQSCLAQINNLLIEQADSARLMTLLLGVLDRSTSTLKYASAGHPMPFLIRSGSAVELPAIGSNIPLGVQSGHRFTNEPSIRLEDGDLLVLLTDGLLEATDGTDQEFGRARLAETLFAVSDLSEDEILAAVFERVVGFRDSAEPEDDYTLMVVRVT